MSGNFKIGENIARQNIARQTAQGGLLLNEPRLCGSIMSHDQISKTKRCFDVKIFTKININNV